MQGVCVQKQAGIPLTLPPPPPPTVKKAWRTDAWDNYSEERGRQSPDTIGQRSSHDHSDGSWQDVVVAESRTAVSKALCVSVCACSGRTPWNKGSAIHWLFRSCTFMRALMKITFCPGLAGRRTQVSSTHHSTCIEKCGGRHVWRLN